MRARARRGLETKARVVDLLRFGRSIDIRRHGHDQYGRTLAHVVIDRHLAVHGIWHIDPIKNVVQAHSWKRRTQPMERKQLPKVVLQTEELSRLAFRMWGTIFWPGRDLSNMVYMFAGHQARKPVKRAVEKWLGRSFQPVRAQRPKNLPSPGRSSKDEAQPTPRAPRPRKG